ncbi:MAG: adenylosuccinate synthase [Chitinivibrionales bacterium]|nr:adenylosuccinate synthase [Chitinivibrionales bacterium]
MPNCIVVGAQWGDEGKAKIIDYLSERSDVVVRFQGGANAGHTVVAAGHKYVFHLIPSGIIYPGKMCVIGSGIVFDAEHFFHEVDDLASYSISVENRLFISNTAHLVLPYHKIIDAVQEESMLDNKIGTTKRGIGPAYADKVNRIGIRTGDLLDWPLFCAKVTRNFNEKKSIITNHYKRPFDCSLDQILKTYDMLRQRIEPMLCDTTGLIYSAFKEKKSILFEGAQGTFLDIDHGTYPYVTSSNTIAGSACVGAGIGPTAIDECIGIVKAYTTRVGNGPFPTELHDSIGEQLRTEGDEFGATTGRPRRCGWFDAAMVRKSIQINGITSIALTKLDVLSSLNDILVCTHYEYRGKRLETLPTTHQELENIKPVYESFPGWNCSINECKKLSDLPTEAMRYVQAIQSLCYDIPLALISVGPDRSQTIGIRQA